ncbi:MAG: hypothetical protein AAB370_11715 [Verrucomicrobiota bacterium]
MKKTTKKTTAPVVTVAVVAAPVVAKATTTAPVATPAPAAPVKAAPAPAKTPIVTAAAPITIEAKINVGFGNKLFVRGQGAGLSWDHGIPLECVDSQTWRLTVPAKDKLQFKLLLNDSVWAQGDDVVAAPGKKVEVTPAF